MQTAERTDSTTGDPQGSKHAYTNPAIVLWPVAQGAELPWAPTTSAFCEKLLLIP
jgi:hypothetical protein